MSPPFTLKAKRGGWSQFPCANCGEQLNVGDEVVMVAVNTMQSHPAHVRCKEQSSE